MRITASQCVCGSKATLGAGTVQGSREINLSIILNQYPLSGNVGVINNGFLKSLILLKEILLIHYRRAVTENEFLQRKGLFIL